VRLGVNETRTRPGGLAKVTVTHPFGLSQDVGGLGVQPTNLL
jgi:hypothetical protein